VVRCKDSPQFIETLKTIDGLLGQKEHNIKIMVIDSISAHHRLDKHSLGKGRPRQRQIAILLRALIRSYNLIVFATKGALFGKVSRFGILQRKDEVYKTYLEEWERMTAYRIIVGRDLEQGRYQHYACVYSPPPVGGELRLLEFDITEGGVVMQ